MTPKEITRSSLLDILFEHRNKQYGAYQLRKQYGSRLGLSIGIMLAAVALALFLMNVVKGKPERGLLPFDKDGGVIVSLAPDPAEPEVPKAPAHASPPLVHTEVNSTIRIVDEPTTVVDQGQLATAAFGNQRSDGPDAGTTVVPLVHSDPGPPTGPEPSTSVTAAPEPEAPSAPPSFPGGLKAWSDFLGRYLRAPADMEPGEKRSVLVRFWVDEEGNVGRFEFVQSAGGSFDNEVLRVLKKMPKWKPALQHGRAVATSFVQPVTFQAPEE